MKLTTPNIVVANPIPDETKVYYSKTSSSIKLVALCCALFLGIYLAATNIFQIDAFVFSVLCVGCIFAIYFIYFEFKKFKSEVPRIIINKHGLQTDSTSFFNWNEIRNAKVIEIGFGRGQSDYLIYHIPEDKEISIKIDDLNITANDLSTLIHFYRERNQNPNFKY
jgi:hypothetical protein